MGDRVAGDTDAIRVPGVYERDALLGDEGGAELVCTVDALYLDADGPPVRVSLDEVTDARVDVDRSVAGFTRIGNAFGCATLLLVAAVVQMVSSPGLPSAAVLGAGVLAVPLTAFAAVWMRRLEVGERQVLQLDHADGNRAVFVTSDANEQFAAIASRVASA